MFKFRCCTGKHKWTRNKNIPGLIIARSLVTAEKKKKKLSAAFQVRESGTLWAGIHYTLLAVQHRTVHS
jgi:hypothetical protein